jgi:large subunit ribosomal protein L15
MVFMKRKKHRRMLGGRSHGYGSHKKHRGAGHRGGTGRAGTSGAKRPHFWKDEQLFGKFGFVSMNQKDHKELRAINVYELDHYIDAYVKQGKAKKEDDAYSIDLKDIDADKLLGVGKTEKKIKITCFEASKGAMEVIKEAGGEIILTRTKRKKRGKRDPKLKAQDAKTAKPAVKAEKPAE